MQGDTYVLCAMLALLGEYDDWPGCPRGDVSLDVRDPAVRDALVRAIWRKLRPDEPEPLTAPRWDNNSERRYSLVGRFMRDVSDATYDVRFRPTPGGRSPESEDIVVPALGDLPRDSFERPQDFADRALLALAAVCVAVLGDGSGR